MATSLESPKWQLMLVWVGLWAPAMIAASHEWRVGEYYDYGWVVPPAALFLLIRRWRELPDPLRLPGRFWVIGGLVCLVPWVAGLRVLGHVDPIWRLPMWLLGMTAVVASHGLLAWSYGWKVSLRFVWITLLLWSALPWPTVVEGSLVGRLTDGVVATVAELSNLFGRPVEVMGDRLLLRAEMVEVTSGCSGVRSFQSFLMATWFFAELQRLGVVKVVALLGFACVTAYGVNVARTMALVDVRFSYGQEAFERAHDWLGLAAFGVSAVLFYAFSSWLGREPRERRITRVRKVEAHEGR